MTREEILRVAVKYIADESGVVYATPDGNVFTENNYHFAVNYAQSKGLELFKFTSKDVEDVKKTTTTKKKKITNGTTKD